MERRVWSRDELLIAFRNYCRIPFGKLHQHNPEIIEIGTLLNRTPSAVAMKLANFASLDPAHKERNVKGLSNASRKDREIYDEFAADWEALSIESEHALSKLTGNHNNEKNGIDLEIPTGETERESHTRVRTVQRFFRSAVLASYDFSCAICQINLPELLTASHIIPWHANVTRRADPTNGLCLCGLHDKAFDRGLLTIDDSFQIVISGRLDFTDPPDLHLHAFTYIKGSTIRLPRRFHPDPIALAYHRENIFSTERTL